MTPISQIDGKPTLAQLIVCRLERLEQLMESLIVTNNPVPINMQIADPFSSEIIALNTLEKKFTIPQDADFCIIQVKGDGQLRLAYGSTPTTDNSFTFTSGDVFKLDSRTEMEKVNLLSTTTNKLTVQYFRYISI